MRWVGIGLLVVALVPAFLSVPVWKQNRYMALMKERVILERKFYALQDSLIVLERQIREMKSLRRIETIANVMGLGFYDAPVKVMEIPASERGRP